jgi:hypothetical protein
MLWNPSPIAGPSSGTGASSTSTRRTATPKRRDPSRSAPEIFAGSPRGETRRTIAVPSGSMKFHSVAPLPSSSSSDSPRTIA